MTEHLTPIEPACTPLVFTYLDPWDARERDIEQIMARGFSREYAEYVLGRPSPFDDARWDAASAEISCMYEAHGQVAAVVERQAAPPRGKRRRSRQVRSTRARARRRVEARERRHEVEVFEVLGVRFSARRDRASAVESVIRSRVEAREQWRAS